MRSTYVRFEYSNDSPAPGSSKKYDSSLGGNVVFTVYSAQMKIPRAVVKKTGPWGLSLDQVDKLFSFT